MPAKKRAQTSETVEDLLNQRGVLQPGFARSLVMNTLANTKGPMTLPDIKKNSGNISTKILAKTLRNAALDGVIEVDGLDVYLTDLGRRSLGKI